MYIYTGIYNTNKWLPFYFFDSEHEPLRNYGCTEMDTFGRLMITKFSWADRFTCTNYGRRDKLYDNVFLTTSLCWPCRRRDVVRVRPPRHETGTTARALVLQVGPPLCPGTQDELSHANLSLSICAMYRPADSQAAGALFVPRWRILQSAPPACRVLELISNVVIMPHADSEEHQGIYICPLQLIFSTCRQIISTSIYVSSSLQHASIRL